MSEPTLWTQSERQALMVSMQHFGNCNCRPLGHGQLATTCDGHRFLLETDRRVDRPLHMLYVRRTREAWIDAEWMGQPRPWDVPTQPVLPALISQTPEAEADSPAELPW